MWSAGIFASNILGCFSIALSTFCLWLVLSSFGTWSVFSWRLKILPTLRILCLSLRSSLLSTVARVCKASLDFWLHPFNLGRRPGSPLCAAAWGLSRPGAGPTLLTLLVSLPQSSLPSMADVQCWRTIVSYTPPGISLVSGRSVNLVFVIPSLLKESVSQLISILRPGKAWSEMNTFNHAGRLQFIP